MVAYQPRPTRVELGAGVKSELGFEFLCRNGAGVLTSKKISSRECSQSLTLK